MNEKSFIGLKKYISYFVLFLVFSFSVYLIFKDLSWCCGDDAQLSDILFDKKLLFGWSGCGRFWPLGLFDYNVFRLFPETRSYVPYYLYNTVILAFSLCIWYKSLNILNKNNYLLSAFGVLVLSSSTAFFQIHMECIFPERFMFFTLSGFLFFSLKGFLTQKTKYYVMAVICAVYTTYCKEPAFVIFLIFSVTNLIFGIKQTKKDKIFNLLLLANSIIYLLVYACLCYFWDDFLMNVYGDCVKDYDPLLKGNTILNSPMTILYVFGLFIEKVEPLFGVLFLLALIRAYFVLIKKDRENLLFDALLFSANGYAFSYILLFLPNTWYLFPEIVLGVPSLIYWFEKKQKLSIFLIIPIIISACFSGSISKRLVKYKFNERKRCRQFFEEIASEYHKGRDLFFFGSRGYAFNGINFCINTSIVSEGNILKDEQDLKNIQENALIFVPKNNYERNTELKNNGFAFVKSFWIINLFSKK